MKEPLNRTKVVIRHLPPTLSLSSFFDQIDARFSSRYNWSSFFPGKSSFKKQKHARAYINFNKPEDVFEFAEFFGGHVFVNEKGTQYKAVVEYAPSQRVPKPVVKKDGREGTIYKDHEYVEFLERVSKPVENLPSADIQLERREAERAGVQEAPIITALMKYVQQKIAAKAGNQAGGRSMLPSPRKPRASKRVSAKKTYILKASGKSANGKNTLVSQRESHLEASNKKETFEKDVGSVSHEPTVRKILLLKGKDQEMTRAKVVASTTETSSAKINQRDDASGKIVKSILLNKETRPSVSSLSISPEQKLQALNVDKGKRPPRPSGVRSSGLISVGEQSPSSSEYAGKRAVDDKPSGREARGFGAGHDRQDRRTRSRERLDRGVWAPLRRSDAPYTSDGFQSKRGDSKFETSQSGHGVEITAHTGGRNNSYIESGSHRHFGRRGPTQNGKDDGSSKKGGIVSHGLHEKQVWVQKAAAGS
ncbi:hypothetical protein RND81_03G054300 [Saponaria officinalis]|uniref:UPF3 domain-containing protein n=1 Tax=Saponaria officinalis TaxID=3572 RepID=A0AAW1LYC3_SAPOF